MFFRNINDIFHKLENNFCDIKSYNDILQYILGRAHTESTRHESTRMSYETNRLGVRGNMDTPMRERRICD